jgi:CDP-glycerol glycerophosphotransferase (TagB/SpsB family)
MYNDCYEECFINPKVSATVKTIILLNLIIQMWLFFRYHEKEIIKTHIKEKTLNNNINNYNNNSNIQNNQIPTAFNTSNSNMIKFFVYDDFYFNSMFIFNTFKNKYFSITSLNYAFSNKFSKIKFEFYFGIFDKNKNLIYPSDFTLYNKMSVLCVVGVNETTIYSLPQIINNQYYGCIEYFDINEIPHFGLHFYQQRARSYLTLNFNFYKYINLSDTNHINDKIFDPNFVKDEYLRNHSKTRRRDTYKDNLLKKNYMKAPISDLKRSVHRQSKKGGWIYKNIYNNYFCFCVGKRCLKEEVKQMCKLNFYKYVIDVNRNLYPKTHFIFVDFIFKSLPSDDTFPVFEEMIKKNMSAHYITEKPELYKEYCENKTKCQTIIPMNKREYFKFGEFVEKYLTLILKLKSVISCKQNSFHYLSYLFYKVEYITYIAVGHGVDFFKDYLFEPYRIYGSKINNKVLIPPSKVLVDLAVRKGWEEENIIQINLPRWDRYSNSNYFLSGNITSNSILIMFTWRYTKWWMGYQDLSEMYHANIVNLLEDEELGEALKKKNMTLYFTLHRYVNRRFLKRYNETINKISYLKFLNQNEISECLSKTNLVVSDFSSVIFDLMSRDKPFVIYVPDENDKNINKLYTNDYIRLIQDFRKGKITFANKCESVKQTVAKIIYYINNNFQLEPKLKDFYKSFNFKTKNNTNEFIDYLINLN